MVDRRIEQLCRDALAALIGSDDEAHDRANVRRAIPRDALELGLWRRMAPPDAAPGAIGNEAVVFRGEEELAARRAVLRLRPMLVVIDETLHKKTARPVRVVRVR